jgi:hypothetical protein
MAPIDEPGKEPKARPAEGPQGTAAEGPKGPSAEERKGRSFATEAASSADLVAFTVEAGTGRIVKIEAVDASGAHHELTEVEKARLAKSEAKATVEGIVEQAFEAGIGCVLGAGGGEKEGPDSEEEAELRQVLLRSLIKRSAARRLMKREVLSQAIVGTLIEHAASSRGAKSERPAH